MANYCHLSYEDRKNIEDGLNENKSINQIAKEIKRSHTTIMSEIERNGKHFEPRQWKNYSSDKYNKDLSCERLNKSPYVCNSCKSRSGCRKIRYTYYAREAQKMYEELLIDCRKGINITQSQVDLINEEIKPFIEKRSNLQSYIY